jgi:hypothetical protein
MTRNRLIRLTVVLTLLAAGCGGPPQVARSHRRLVESMLTAVSTRNPQWVDENARLVESLHEKGELTPAEHEAFTMILATARAGNWDRAEELAYDLRGAQRVTQDDIDQLPQHARL